MSILGTPTEWVNLIDPMVPQILHLVLSTWDELPAPAADSREDDITNALCRALRDNRTARSLMFQIDTQQVELDPQPGQELGRLDIAFRPLVPREDIYFCLECKRLNVIVNGQTRAYAAEYVTQGMLRFVTGQYARSVRHGGMVGYVLDGDIARAVANVESNLRAQRAVLCMPPPGGFLQSSILINEIRAKETHHRRVHETIPFFIHHLFMPSGSSQRLADSSAAAGGSRALKTARKAGMQ